MTTAPSLNIIYRANTLGKTSVTECRYKALYVDSKCCLIALINRIIYCLFGSRGCWLGNAAHATVSLKQEREAIQAYVEAKNKLLSSKSDKAVEEFFKAFIARETQLQTLDNELIHKDMTSALKFDLDNEELLRKVASYEQRQIKAADEECETALADLAAAFKQTHNVQQEPLATKIKNYATALNNYVAVDRAAAEDGYDCFWENVATEFEKDKTEAVFLLKCAIAKQLPFLLSLTYSQLFTKLYEKDVNNTCSSCACLMNLEFLQTQKDLLIAIQRSVDGAVSLMQEKYDHMGDFLATDKGITREESAQEDFRECVAVGVLMYIHRQHGEALSNWLDKLSKPVKRTDLVELVELLPLIDSSPEEYVPEAQRERCDAMIRKILEVTQS